MKEKSKFSTANSECLIQNSSFELKFIFPVMLLQVNPLKVYYLLS